MPRVSIIVPVYGVEKYIERCACSLFEQTMTDIEFIFVDDCSPDRSVEILSRIINEYQPRLLREKKFVRIERMPTNSGLAAVRRHGIQLATGEYIAHCDSDDWVDVDLYEKMYDKAIREDADVVVCTGKSTDGVVEKKIKYERHISVNSSIDAMMHRKMWWSLCDKMIRRSLYGQGIIFPDDNMGEDMCMTLQLMTYCKNIEYVDASYHYYKNPTSIMNDVGVEKKLKNYEQLCRNIEKVRSFYKKNNLSKTYKKGLNYLIYNASFILYGVINDVNCKKKWSENIRISATNVIVDNKALMKERVRAIYFIIKTCFK